jgi:GTP cyclohydrolase I
MKTAKRKKPEVHPLPPGQYSFKIDRRVMTVDFDALATVSDAARIDHLAKVSTEDLIREAMRRTFTHVDMTEESLIETPKRVAKFWREFNTLSDTQAILERSFDNKKGSSGMVVQKDLPFRALCEHHLLPFYGKVHLAYMPSKRVVGLSKLARLVKAVGVRRPSVQETITEELCELLHSGLESRGAIVVVKAEHTCMSVRGVCAPGVVTTTSSIKGIFRDAGQMRSEFFALLDVGD